MTRDQIADAWLSGGWHTDVLRPVERPAHDNVVWVRENKPFALSLAERIADFVLSLHSQSAA